ncbi:MAG TPA: hypothetical protein VFG54_13280 [Prolixibacteraceae bacterium]|nr:hypothetical protein [Prolixibacteraceae bacterium]
MNIKPHHFNSKLLLFGEYGLMFNAMALSLPFSRFYGSLEYDPSGENKKSTAEIRKLYTYLSSLEETKLHYPLHLKAMRQDLDQGLYFNSTIPLQYGLGSSGALVAALFSRYSLSPSDNDSVSLDLLKADFALLESFFHGKSSGLDPLTSFMNRPLLLDSKKKVQPCALNLGHTGWAFALMDTRTTGATGPLVKHFIESMKVDDFKTAFHANYIPANNGCIKALLKGEKPSFFAALDQLIEFELQYLKQMFPMNFRALIKQALNEKVYIKLLGSGGGGYLLAIAPSEELLANWAESKDIPLINVSSR